MHRLEYEGLKQFCENELQRERLDLYFELESFRVVSKKLGCSKSAVKQTINLLRNRAARKGFSPDDDAAGLAPDGFAVKGKSILRWRRRVGWSRRGWNIRRRWWWRWSLVRKRSRWRGWHRNHPVHAELIRHIYAETLVST